MDASKFDSARDVTLQVNLSPGDVAYGRLTVPALVRAHPRVAARLAVVDCCRARRTRIFDPERRLAEPGFSERVAEVRRMASEFESDGLFDRVVYLMPGDPLLPQLARKYVRPWMRETHDYAGCAFAAYWAGFDLPTTRFVAHFDADMMIYQAPGFDWLAEALSHWEELPSVVAATPRISPSGFAACPEEDAPSAREGRPKERAAGGWVNDWFSTRCLLLDRERLAPHLPLVGGRLAWEYRLRRWLDRGYPPVPEGVLFRVLGPRGLRRLNLDTEQAWLLHPQTKPPEFVALLPQMLSAIAAGRVPPTQRGETDVQLAAWQSWLAEKP